MGDQFQFSVTKRDVLGKKVQQLRKQGKVVGNISAKEESLAFQAEKSAFMRLIRDASETSIIYVQVEGETQTRPVLLEEVELDGVTGDVIHVVLRQVSLKEKITAEVAVEIIGEVNVPGTVLVTVQDAVEVEALPTDLPEKFEIDVSVLTEAGQSITLADLVYDKSKVELVLPEDADLENMPLVLLQEVKEEVEETTDEAQDVTAGAGEAGKSAEQSGEEKAGE